MNTGFITFTLLWAVSCTIIYFQLKKKLDEARRLLDDANKMNAQAIQDSHAAQKHLCDLIKSMQCLN